jgi:hypothetical protein
LIYLSGNLIWAIFFAGCHRSGQGQVYEVEPVEGLERDPDRPDEWWRCTRARIIRRVPIKAAQMQHARSVLAETRRERGL